MIMPMKMPATARRRRIAASLYHDDALTDGLAEERRTPMRCRLISDASFGTDDADSRRGI
jgi:hypothetical protein